MPMWSENGPCYIIAEAGSNHDGEARYAREFPEHFEIYPSHRFWDADYPEGEELPPFFRYASDTESHDSIQPSLARPSG